MSKNAVCFGEVLWDLLPSGKVAGGAPMNVAFHLQQLGVDARMISRIGADALGAELLHFLQEKQVNTEFIQEDPHQPTGIVEVSFSEHNEPQYTIVQPVAWDFIEYSAALQQLVAESSIFVHGSLIARGEQSFQTLKSLIEVAPQRIFDVNLRRPFFSRELIESLLPKATLLKMNEEEAQLLSEWFVGGGSWQEALPRLQERFQLGGILVTLGKAGAYLLHDGKSYTQPGFSVKVQDTIGSGDAFLAGFLSQWLQGQAPQHCLRFACAMGALIAGHRGALPSLAPEDVLVMMEAANKTE